MQENASRNVTYTSDHDKFEFDRKAIADAFSIVLPADLFVLFLAAGLLDIRLNSSLLNLPGDKDESALSPFLKVLFLLGDFRERLALLDPNGLPSISIGFSWLVVITYLKKKFLINVPRTTWRKKFEKI